MREILFKAKGRDGEGWQEGFYWNTQDTTYCVQEDYERNPENTHHYLLFDRMTDWGLPNRKYRMDIDTETLCQYTGLMDKKNQKIWENDIIEFDDTGEEGYEYKEGFDFRNRAVIVWKNGRFELDKLLSDNSGVLELMNDSHEEFWDSLKDCEVIGNIFDNPELLSQKN